MNSKFSFCEFFAGGGMARAGLGRDWACLFANDFDPKKAATYIRNWGNRGFVLEDVARLDIADLPHECDLIWASFPCQDLSLAGAGAGLRGERSGTFWPFWKLVNELQKESRAPRLVVLENVCGALTSHDGKDFAAIGTALSSAGYLFGALVIDAVQFVPQSRPRLFIIATKNTLEIPQNLQSLRPSSLWHTAGLLAAHTKLSAQAKKAWIWWDLPTPPVRKTVFADLIEENPSGVVWRSVKEVKDLLSMMSPINRDKVKIAQTAGHRMVGGLYRRTRVDQGGKRVQRAEIRFDDVAGCLRTPRGGSSRQSILIVDGSKIRSRLLSSREAARLMGLPDSYVLPDNYNEAYHVAGDGLVVPVVRYLASNLLEPLLQQKFSRLKAA